MWSGCSGSIESASEKGEVFASISPTANPQLKPSPSNVPPRTLGQHQDPEQLAINADFSNLTNLYLELLRHSSLTKSLAIMNNIEDMYKISESADMSPTWSRAPNGTKVSEMLSRKVTTPRVEKGTIQVDDRENKKDAAELLFALSQMLEHKDKQVRSHFLSSRQNKIEDVISKFGIQVDRAKTSASSQIKDFVEEEMQHKHVQVALDYAQTIKAQLGRIDEQFDRPANSTAENSMNTYGRTTRAGTGSKRAIDIIDLEATLKKLNESVKKIKSSK